MTDEYQYRIDRGGIMWAGYHVCRLTEVSLPPFLFDTLRLNRVLSGSAEWQIGGKICSIRAGDIIAVNNIEPRQFLRIDQKEPFVVEVFSVSPMLFGGEPACLRLFYQRTPAFDPVVSRCFPENGRVSLLLDAIRDGFLSISSEGTGVTPRADTLSAQICGLLTGVCALMLGAVEASFPETLESEDPEGPTGQAVASLIDRSFRYVRENISSPFTVSDLAANVFLSRGYYSELFRRYLGQTPADFVRRLRIGNAFRLIGSGDHTVFDAAVASGFGSASAFYRAFREVYGTSPKEVLQRLGSHSGDLAL